MDTQYAGVRPAGRTGKCSSRASTSVATIRYSTTPAAHRAAASAASPPGSGPGSAVSATATDWVPTMLRNQLPLLPASADAAPRWVIRASGIP